MNTRSISRLFDIVITSDFTTFFALMVIFNVVFSLSMQSFNKTRISLLLSIDWLFSNIGHNATRISLSVTEKGRCFFYPFVLTITSKLSIFALMKSCTLFASSLLESFTIYFPLYFTRCKV